MYCCVKPICRSYVVATFCSNPRSPIKQSIYFIPETRAPHEKAPLEKPLLSLFPSTQVSGACSDAILASILLLAARIISSRLRCSEACLSSRFELHPLPFLSSSAASWDSSAVSLLDRLYRVIRSGCDGSSGCLVAVEALAPPEALCAGGGGGWKVIGGYTRESVKAILLSS